MTRCKAALLAVLCLSFLAVPAHSTEQPVHLTVFGDSLSAGYRLAPGKGFPEQLAKALEKAGDNVVVNNAGVSGDTSSGGLARFEWAIDGDTDAVILELGANDALRGIDPALTKSSLETIITRLKDQGVKILLAGMLAPPNMGPDYAARFNPIYADLAQTHGLGLYPFFLDGVAADPSLNLDDGIHPSEQGIAIIVERILPDVRKLIAQARAD